MYYLQSRYYSPQNGRFLNADVYASTGQGVLGHNMFAYCLNNPVNHSDKSGRTADDWAGWIGEELGELFYELITGDDHPSHQTREIERQVRQKQTESFVKGIQKCWDAYVHSIELETEAQYRQDMYTIRMVKYLAENPTTAINLAINGIGMATSYISLVATVGIITIPVPVNVALAAIGLVCSLWGDVGAHVELWSALSE